MDNGDNNHPPPAPENEQPPPSSPPPSSPPPSSPPPSSPPPSSSPPPASPPPSSPPPDASPPPKDASPPPKDSTPPPKDASPPPKNSTPPPSDASPPPKDASPPPKDASPPPKDASPPPKDASPPPPKDSPPPPNDSSNPPPSPQNSKSSHPPPPNRNNRPSTSPPPPSPDSFDDFSPPPPTKALAPSSSSNEPSAGLPVPIIVGAAVGAGLLLVLLLVVFMVCNKKKKKTPPSDQYYKDHPGRKSQGAEYYNGSHPGEHVVKISPGGAMGAIGHHQGHGGGWPNPSPAPGRLSSGEVSSNLSGQHGPPLPPPHPSLALGFNKSTFTYDELAAATGGFSKGNLLGQGGFGYVHKGVLPNGKEIAVKSLKFGSGQGEREFQAEVEIISRVHHRHLVSLVGYCIAGEQRMLVYEFVPNNNLEFHLYGTTRPAMDWSTRLKIAMGSAKGLAYLHEDCHPKIIHRDIKTANILLDFNFEAKVADFGLAKLSSDNYTHVSTRIMGTFGYLAPEYASSGKLTEKSDVFSFGVMLLELITGRRPVDTTNSYMEDSLVDWARPLMMKAMEDRNFEELADPRLEKNFNNNEMHIMVACAAAAIRHSARRRPKMSQIVRALEGDVSLDDLNEGVKPGNSSAFGSTSSSEYDTQAYNADIKKFRKMALQSEEFPSSEFGADTSEYGVNPSSSSSEYSQNEGRRNVP